MAFEGLTEKLSSAFKKLRNKGRLTESDVKEAMREIRLALLEADVIKAVTEKAVGTEVLESLTPAQAIVKIVNQELVSLMGGGSAKITIASQPPTVVMMVGLQGAGKTTNAAKLAGLMRKQNGKRPLLAACDIYRPAAIQQLEVVGKQLDIPVFQMGQENPVTIAEAAIAHAKKHGNDMVFLDTAGRLHVDEALMEELQAIKQAVQPSEILLVVDAMIGQDAVNAAKAFDDALESRILGMGDVLTLIEKAEQQFDMQKAQELAEKLKKNRFTLQDYYDQLVQVKGMGSMDELLGMMPGLNAKALEGATINEKALSRTEAIILSMTPQERENPAILNSSRKKRIAAGCGLQVVDVNRLLKEFGMMQQMTKQMTKLSGKRRKGKFGKFPGGLPGLPF